MSGTAAPFALTLDKPWNDTVVYDEPIALDIESTEKKLLEHLQTYAAAHGGPLKHVEITQFPGKPETYRFIHPVGTVLLMFAGVYDGMVESADSRVVHQCPEYTWHLATMNRSLGWGRGGWQAGDQPGAYQIIEALRLALSGLSLPGFTPMTRHSAVFIKQDAGVWTYQSTFAHTTASVNEVPEENFPPLRRIDFNEITSLGALPGSLSVELTEP